MRLEHLNRVKRPINNGKAIRDIESGSGGRGMGGGGGGAFRGAGSPGYKPQIPEEFKEIMAKKQEERMKEVVAGRQSGQAGAM
jgi:hypothetical protein